MKTKQVDPVMAKKLKIESEFIAQNTIRKGDKNYRKMNIVMARRLYKEGPKGNPVEHELLYLGKYLFLVNANKKSAQIPWGGYIRKHETTEMTMNIDGKNVKGTVKYLVPAKGDPNLVGKKEFEEWENVLGGEK